MMSKKENEKSIMKKPSVSTGRVLKRSALIVSVVALVIAGGMTGCAGNRYNQSTTERDAAADSSRIREVMRTDTQTPAASESNRYRDMGLRTSPPSPMGSPNGSLNF
jgi:hypothetical protein